jgi:hypothetical protein
MAQHDYVIANQSGSAFRADLNNAFSATVTGNSGANAPSTTYSYMIWNDTTSNQRKIRNSANNAWIVLSTLSGGNVFDDDVTFNGANYNLVWDKSDNALEFADNAKCNFGSSGDLSAFHNGANSFIQNQTGNLVIASNRDSDTGGDIWIDALNGERSVKCIHNGAVFLYFNGSPKLETNSEGVKIDGYLEMLDNKRIQLGTNDDLQLYSDGSDSYVLNTTDTDLIIKNNGNAGIEIINQNSFPIELKTNAETSIKCNANGSVALHYDGGNPKFETTSYGMSTNITNALRWTEDSNAASRSWQLTGEDGDYGIFELLCNNSDGGTVDQTAIKAISGGAVELHHNGGTAKFATTSTGATVTGSLTITALPTSDPSSAGALWNDSGTVKVSAG